MLKKIPNGYSFKVSLLDLGVFIAGFTARESKVSDSGWWVQPPARKVGDAWRSVVEFDKGTSLWDEIEIAVIHQIELEELNLETNFLVEDKPVRQEEIDAIFPN